MNTPPKELARHFDLDALRHEEGVVVALDGDDRITWMNDAWTRFATENGGEGVLARYGLGARYLDGTRGPLVDYFARAFASVRASREPWEIEYECSSLDFFRLCRMRVLPSVGLYLLVEHDVVESRPHDRAAEAPSEADYRDGHGLLVQCSNCRRVRRVGGGWRWIPAWVAAAPTPPVSHGLCATCEGLYVARMRDLRRARRGGEK